jgi:hypothetical protein
MQSNWGFVRQIVFCHPGLDPGSIFYMKIHIKHWIPTFVGMTVLLLFSFFLMMRTFGYDSASHTIHIAPKLWSDFGAHIPMIRSFSMGPNLDRLIHNQPIESPLYPGEPIRYHFGFYAIAGILEKLGVRLDWALNIPSAAGLFLLLLTIYWVSYELFQNAKISILSVIFFLCNGTLSFLAYFQKNPLSPHTVADIITTGRFATFGPWDGQDVTAFWTLNIYTNQRHLALSYGIVLLILLIVIRLKKQPTGLSRSLYGGALIGLLAAFLFFINFAAASILGLFLVWLFLAHKEGRIPLVISSLIAFPAILVLRHLTNISSSIAFEPGYLAHHPLTWQTLVTFWFQNLGLHMVLAPFGLLLSPKKVKKLLLVPLLLLFLLPNVFRFSTDMINNHKFFNFFIILAGMFSAFAIIRIGRIRHIGPICLIGCIFFLTLSGFIDFFPVINDNQGGLVDIQGNPDAHYFLDHTPKDAIVADSYWFYHPASLTGRSIYSGYTYFTWSYGYDQGKREQQLIHVYRATSQDNLCKLLTQDNISYIELSAHPEAYLQPNMVLWNNLVPVYKNPDTGLRIYETNKICTAIPL